MLCCGIIDLSIALLGTTRACEFERFGPFWLGTERGIVVCEEAAVAKKTSTIDSRAQRMIGEDICGVGRYGPHARRAQVVAWFVSIGTKLPSVQKNASARKLRSGSLIFTGRSIGRGLSINNRLNYRCGSFRTGVDRKSTRLNSSHSQISYAVFCLT